MAIWSKNKPHKVEVQRRLPAHFYINARVGIKMPSAFRDIFFHPASMTSILNQLNNAKISVEMLAHHWQKPHDSEWQCLQKKESWGIGRDVVLHGVNEPWMYARTFIPESVVRSQGTAFSALGERPLGEILFSHPLCRRGNFNVAFLRPGHREYHICVQHLKETPEYLWARHSLFTLPAGEISLLEVFFPSLEKAAINRSIQ